jgi:hypothetical protein
MAAVAKTAKLEADKKKKKRKKIPTRHPRRSRKRMKPLMIRRLLTTVKH